MAIPFIIAGVAAIAGAYGAKKGYDAYKDNGEASDVNDRAHSIFDNAQDKLNSSREKTNTSLEMLGKLKVDLFNSTFPQFITEFQRIQNIEKSEGLSEFDEMNDSENIVLELKEESLKLTELAGGTLASLGSGVLAGFGAFGGAGMLATASTGTAISSLSGVAATNATLAWFGGGSLAAGGLGMAGGTAILGGIVAGPVLAVAGGMLAAKAEKAKYEAYQNLEQAKAEVHKLDSARVIVNAISERADDMFNLLSLLKKLFNDGFFIMVDIINKSTDYRSYSTADKESIAKIVSIVKTLKNLTDTPLLEENGELTIRSKQVMQDANDLIEKLELAK